MSKQKYLVVAAIAVFGLFLSATSSQAQTQVFGYPAGGSACAGGGCGGGLSHGAQQRAFGYGQISDRFEVTQEQNSKIYARNEAWPKPFACASRQHYHNLFNPMYDAGWEDQNMLTSVHFDKDGELTRYGRQQISGMMLNMPRARRVIFIQETSNVGETQARAAKVRNVINTWYSQRGGMVQVSNRTPATMNGTTAVNITEQAQSSAPAPVIPIANSGGTVASAIGN